jgi:hypothetical protein
MMKLYVPVKYVEKLISKEVAPLEKRKKAIERELAALSIGDEKFLTTALPWIKQRRTDLRNELSEVNQQLETPKTKGR